MQVVDANATWVRTMGRGYNKNRSTEPKLQHPTDPALMRIFTPVEHARAKGEDPAMVKGLPASIAHALLGQGITPPPFRAVGELIGRCLRVFAKLPVPEQRPHQRERKHEPVAQEAHQEVSFAPMQLSIF